MIHILLMNGINKGISPQHIIVSGQSAGGGLCLALLLKIKESNISQPLGAVALSPLTHLSNWKDNGNK